jgi:regulator of sirC expression with transglutaminase-like and TPR domain
MTGLTYMNEGDVEPQAQMIDKAEIVRILTNAGAQPDFAIDIGECALALAALDRPRVDLTRYRRHLVTLSDEIAEAALDRMETGTPDLEARIDAIRAVVYGRYGYAGDSLTYDDLQNANLMRVIDRRKGMPIALGILVIALARNLEWAAEGINFPGHFLVRLACGGRSTIVDPFNGGEPCGVVALRELLKSVAGPEAELEPTHYTPAKNRDVLLRLQNNIKLRLLREGSGERAARIIEAMLMIAPDNAALWRESGLIHGELGNMRRGLDELRQALALERDPRSQHQTAVLIQELSARVN